MAQLLTLHEIQEVTNFPIEGHHRRVGSRMSLVGFILQPLPLHLQHKLQILEAEKSRAPVFVAELWILVHSALFTHLQDVSFHGIGEQYHQRFATNNRQSDLQKNQDLLQEYPDAHHGGGEVWPLGWEHSARQGQR